MCWVDLALVTVHICSWVDPAFVTGLTHTCICLHHKKGAGLTVWREKPLENWPIGSFVYILRKHMRMCRKNWPIRSQDFDHIWPFNEILRNILEIPKSVQKSWLLIGPFQKSSLLIGPFQRSNERQMPLLYYLHFKIFLESFKGLRALSEQKIYFVFIL